MIHFTTGNLFHQTTEAIVIPVNCIGIAGAGIALQCKKQSPRWFNAYKEDCAKGRLIIGTTTTFQTNTGPNYINFPTKHHWKNPSRPIYINLGLIALKHTIEKHNIKSIAMPPIGCGLGGLFWNTVKPLIEGHLAHTTANITVLEPNE